MFHIKLQVWCQHPTEFRKVNFILEIWIPYEFLFKELSPTPHNKNPRKQQQLKTTTTIIKLTNKSKIKNKNKTITVCHSTKMKELIVNYQHVLF